MLSGPRGSEYTCISCALQWRSGRLYGHHIASITRRSEYRYFLKRSFGKRLYTWTPTCVIYHSVLGFCVYFLSKWITCNNNLLFTQNVYLYTSCAMHIWSERVKDMFWSVLYMMPITVPILVLFSVTDAMWN